MISARIRRSWGGDDPWGTVDPCDRQRFCTKLPIDAHHWICTGEVYPSVLVHIFACASTLLFGFALVHIFACASTLLCGFALVHNTRTSSSALCGIALAWRSSAGRQLLSAELGDELLLGDPAAGPWPPRGGPRARRPGERPSRPRKRRGEPAAKRAARWRRPLPARDLRAPLGPPGAWIPAGARPKRRRGRAPPSAREPIRSRRCVYIWHDTCYARTHMRAWGVWQVDSLGSLDSLDPTPTPRKPRKNAVRVLTSRESGQREPGEGGSPGGANGLLWGGRFLRLRASPAGPELGGVGLAQASGAPGWQGLARVAEGRRLGAGVAGGLPAAGEEVGVPEEEGAPLTPPA
jgi:hypothetical protein